MKRTQWCVVAVVLAVAASSCGPSGPQQNTGGGAGGGDGTGGASGGGSGGGTGGAAAPTTTAVLVEPASGSSSTQVTVKVGESVQLKATAILSDGTQKDVTADAQWISQSPSRATVAAGLVTPSTAGGAATAGQVIIQAISDNRTGTRSVTVDDLVGVQVTPTNVALEVGQTQAYTATGHWLSGPNEDVTARASWSSTSAATATISDAGVATVTGGGGTTIVARLPNGVTGSTLLRGIALSSIDVTSAGGATSVPAGLTLQLTATGSYTNSTTTKDITAAVTWASNNTTRATIDGAGLLTTLKAGAVSFTATDAASGISRSFSLTVSAALLSGYSLPTPATTDLFAGQSLKLTATGTFTDGTQADVSDKMTWSSDAIPVVRVNSLGWVTGVGLGVAATITATPAGFAQDAVLPASWPLAAKTVSGFNVLAPAVVAMHVFPKGYGFGYQGKVPVAAVSAFTAWASYSDGTTHDESATATWTSSATGTATSLGAGRFKGVAAGTATITASLDGVDGTLPLSVFAATGGAFGVFLEGTGANCLLTRESLQATPRRMFQGAWYELDPADVQSWSSDAPSALSVNSGGLLTAGTTNNAAATITFSYLEPGASAAVNGSASLTVYHPDTYASDTFLTDVPPPTVSSLQNELPIGATRTVTVATTACGSRATRFTGTTIMWGSSSSAAATVSTQASPVTAATVKARAAGGTTISVAGPLARNYSLTVVDASLRALTLNSQGLGTIATGRWLNLKVSGRYLYPAGNVWKSNLTIGGPVVWTTTNPAVAFVTDTGVLHAVGPGSADISAHAEGQAATQTMKVSNVASLSVAPISLYPDVTEANPRTVTATLDDGTTTTALPYPVTFAVADTTIATLDYAKRLVGGAPGTTTFTATDTLVPSRTATATITTHDLTSVTVAPTSLTLYGLAGAAAAYLIPTVTYADGTSGTSTPAASFTFTSQDPSVATVTSAGIAASATTFGSTTVTVSMVRKPSVTATATVNVPAPSSAAITPATATLSVSTPAQKTKQLSVLLSFAGTSTTVTVSSGVPWLSSDPAVATVSASGLVTAVAQGSTTLSAPSWTYGGQVVTPSTAAVTVNP